MEISDCHFMQIEYVISFPPCNVINTNSDRAEPVCLM